MTLQNTPDASNDDATAGGAATKPRRRASRPAAAPVAVEPAARTTVAGPEPAAPVAGPEPAAPAAESAPEPADAAPKPVRRRATRSRKAPEPPVEETPADEPGATPEEVVVEETTETPVLAPRLATTALLFQAPDLTQVRPRRRRATATAGSPEEISQAARRAETEAQVAEPVEPETPAADETPAPSRARRGRGRGKRADEQTDEQVDETVETAETAETLELAETLEPADESEEPDEAAEGEEGAAGTPRRRRRRGGRGRRGRGTGGPAEAGDEPSDDDEPEDAEAEAGIDEEPEDAEGTSTSRRRRRRRRGGRPEAEEPRRRDEVTALRGSTRLEAKRQRRREGRDAGRRRQIISEAEFLARRESVDRAMVVRERDGRTQIAVLEDGVLVEHYVSDQAQASMVGNVYLGRVQNVLPSMEAAFVDVGKGRNAVLYAGEVNWDAAGLEGGQPRRIEQALKSGDPVLVQVTKDPIGHKGARLTSQVTLAGRYLVFVPGGGMTGISRKLPDTERNRLKKILRDVVPESAGVIVRTAAEGASEEELEADIARLTAQWEAIEAKAAKANAPALLQGEPDMAIRVVRDIFNDDFSTLVVQGDEAWSTISSYVAELAPDLAARVTRWTGNLDVFTVHRVDEQLAKGMDRKVWLPSGGSLVIDRTEAMTVVDVNTGKFTGAGGTLEETVTRNNLEAAEEIVRQLRLRDIGGIIVIDFIDMVLESNRDLVLRRLVECLGRDRTKHQVAEVTSLGLVQMTRKRVGQGLVEAFSETCEHCHGRGFIVHNAPVERNPRPDAGGQPAPAENGGKRSRRKRAAEPSGTPVALVPVLPEAREAVKATLATIAAAAAHAHEKEAPFDWEAPSEGMVEAESHDEPTVPVLDVLAELAARLPVGDRPPAASADLSGLADLAAGVAVAEDAVAAEEAAPDEPETELALELEPVDPGLFDAPADEPDGETGGSVDESGDPGEVPVQQP